MSRFLFIGGHADDVELSCGGTIFGLVSNGITVDVLAVSICGSIQLQKEFNLASDVLGVSKRLVHYDFGPGRPGELSDHFYFLRNDYDFVFTHSDKCRHTEHRIAGEESKRVFNCNLITYMQPWNGNENPNYFIELSEEQLEKKIQALSCYKSQAHRKYMDPDFIRSWARYTGIKCGKKYAEGFKIERLIQ